MAPSLFFFSFMMAVLMHYPKQSSNRLSRARIWRVLFGFETLEKRQLLAADTLLTSEGDSRDPAAAAVQAAPTHRYLLNGDQVGMHIHPQRIALAFRDSAGVPGAPRLEAALDAVEDEVLQTHGVRHVRELASGGFSVYETTSTTDELTAALARAGIGFDGAPVFVLHASNSEAVLLDELIVSLRPGVVPEAYFAGQSLFSGYRRLDGTPNQFVATVSSGRGERALEALQFAQATADAAVVEWIEPNFYQDWQRYYIPNDPRFGNLWHLHNVGQLEAVEDADSDLPEAWDFNRGGSFNYVIGVIDDGVESHPDLALWVNPGEIPGNGIDDDNNGWIDDVHGWNFVFNNNQSHPTTATDSHGTAVAGVAAARGDNGIGVVGASYNSRVSSAKMFQGSAVASDANIAAALYYMAGRTANGQGTWKSADLVNNSWGGGGFSNTINAAISWGTVSGRLGAGTPYFFASGNSSGSISYPASQAASIGGVFAVGATNSRGTRSNYSNFGAGLDFVAPSNDTRAGYLAIDTTDRVGGNGYASGDYTGNGSTGFGGTSSATPLAAGIAALVMDQADDLGVVMSPAGLKAYLRNSTDLIGGVGYDMVSGINIEYGFGRLNAATAVAGIGKTEISVLAPLGELVDGSSVSDFGVRYLTEPLTRVFRIRNQGTTTLDLSDLSLTSSDFTLVSGPADTSLSLGEATTFSIRFDATTLGTHTSTVSILSNDADEGVFTFDVTGRATVRSISGYVMEDWDGDNEFDAQDVPLSGWTVFIDANDNGQVDQGERTTVTDASGYYFFDEVPVGSYVVRTLVPSGWVATGENAYPLTISEPGQVVRDVNFTSAKNDRFYAIVYNDANQNGSFDADELPLANRQLFVDFNGNGSVDSEFITQADAPGALIPNNSTQTFPLAIAGAQYPITDVDVRVDFTMTWNGDLQVYLQHPDGTLVELFTNVGGSSDNFTDTILDDQAAVSITSGTAPYTGRFRPEGSLAVLNGKAADGTWGLRVSDPFSGFNEATLNDWELMITTGESVQTTNAQGAARFDLLPGAYDVHLQPLEAWDHTLPTGGVRAIVTTGAPLVAQYYGSRKLPPAVSGYVLEDWDGDGQADPQDVPLAGRVVYLDQNNNGQYEPALESNAFTQPTSTDIPNNATIRSPLVVNGFTGVISDVNIGLDITHSWVSDLDAALISPDGTRVVLFNGIGGANDNFVDTVFDDEATTPIGNGTAPYTGSFRPFGLLSDFDNRDPNGTWYLEVTDDFGLNAGVLNDWSLAITAGERSTRSDASGFYLFDVLDNGTYDVRSAAADDWITTGDNHHRVTITSPLDSFADRNFGTAKNNRLYAIVFDDADGDGSIGQGELGLAGREVFIDSNGNGTVDNLVSNFINSTTLVLPDRSTRTSPLDVSLTASPILDVDVRVNITSTFNFELQTYLIHPDGTRVELFTNVGGSSQNFTNTILDDQATTSIVFGTAPFTGRFRPEGLLSALNGKSPNGTWRLELTDVFTGNSVTLNAWELILTTAEPLVTTNSVGAVYLDLMPGTYDLMLQARDEWTYTSPVDGRRQVTASGGPLFAQTFGTRPEDLVPPSVSASIVAGSTWPAAFRNFVAGGTGLGLELSAGAPPLVFDDLDRLYLQFSESVVDVGQDSVELRNSFGLVPFNLVFDPVTYLATLQLSSPLAAGKYRLSASDTITDLSGNALDGDGSGAGGSIYSIRFDVLPGDANGDQRVNGADLAGFSAAFNAQVGQAIYDVRADWNADGRVNGADLSVFSANFNSRIDNLAEPGSPFNNGPQRAMGYSGPRDDSRSRPKSGAIATSVPGAFPAATARGYDHFFGQFGEDEEDD